MVHICKTTVVVKYIHVCSTVFKKEILKIIYLFSFFLSVCFEHVVPCLLHRFQTSLLKQSP